MAEPIGGANGDEPFSSVSIATSAAAHPRRSPRSFGLTKRASMPIGLQALLISTAVVLCIAAVLAVVGHFHRKRVFARLVALRCPSCSRSFGSGILSTMRSARYLWNPAPGYTVSRLQLPGGTFLLTCPHCSAEAEFTEEGQVFEPPKEGVRSFTRFVRA